ncbi:MAG: FAD-dependent oxidoreductase, partial [Acidimicrobiia bacterium]
MSNFDTVVIGAGVIGLSTAWRLAQAGLRVLVLDRDHPGAGASGVAAGMLAPVTEAAFGEEALLELNLTAARRFSSFLDELQETAETKISFDSDGTLYAAFDRD